MLPGYEHITSKVIDGKTVQAQGAGSFQGGGPKLGLHTTEGPKAEGAITALYRNRSWSHFLLSFEENRKIQFLELNVAGKSMSNSTIDGYPTNRSNMIQVEIVGYAAEAVSWPKEKLEWLAQCFKEIRQQFNFPLNHLDFVNGVRLSDQDFHNYKGIVGHKHAPDNCVAVDTPVLCADLQWRSAGDLLVGDEIIGFDEDFTPGDRKGRKLRTSTITFAGRSLVGCSEITTSRGTITATHDHPWFCKNVGVQRGTRFSWVKTQDLDPELHEIAYFGEPWTLDGSREAGWLAGLLDADGSLSITTRFERSCYQIAASLQFGQKPGRVLDEFILEMQDRGFEFNKIVRPFRTTDQGGYGGRGEFCDARLKGGTREIMRLLGTVYPKRLSNHKDLRALWEDRPLGKMISGETARILAVDNVGEKEIANLTTSTQTYIANGFLCHNTHWDPGQLDVPYIVSKIGEQPMKLGESKILGVNQITEETASVWGQIACNEQGCGLWRFTIDGWASIIPNGSPVFRGTPADKNNMNFPLFSVTPGTAEISVDVDGPSLVVTLTGAPKAAVFQMWVPVARG